MRLSGLPGKFYVLFDVCILNPSPFSMYKIQSAVSSVLYETTSPNRSKTHAELTNGNAYKANKNNGIAMTAYTRSYETCALVPRSDASLQARCSVSPTPAPAPTRGATFPSPVQNRLLRTRGLSVHGEKDARVPLSHFLVEEMIL